MQYSYESAKEDYELNCDNTNPIKCKGVLELNSIEEENFSPKSNNEKKEDELTIKEESSINLKISNYNYLNHIVDSSFNYAGNYENYVTNVLTSIIKLKNEIKDKENTEKKEEINNEILKNKIKNLLNNSNKQILLLDLDETLIHADFEGIFKNLNNYDTIINFNDNKSNYSIGIFLRPGIYDFLNILKEKFDIFIYTASTKEYADSIIKFLDPQNQIFKMTFYRENCININGQIFIKDLSLFENLDKIVIVDNSLYSFMEHLSNGILINSFYGDKSDIELYSVLNYLISFVCNCDDIRQMNEQFFNFKGIMNEIKGNMDYENNQKVN